MRLRRLLEARSLSSTAFRSTLQQSGLPQHPPHAGRTDRHDVGIQHHERQPPVALQRVLQMELDDRLLLPILQPEIPGNPTVVLVTLAVALSPIVKLAAGHAQPSDEPSGADLGRLRPAPHEIHDLIPHIVRNPDPVQSSPSFFLARRAPPSVRPGPRPCSGSSSPDTRSVPVRPGGRGGLWSGRPRLRSRRTLSASGRKPSAASPSSSHSFETGSCSSKCRLRMATFSSPV